jgi:hypothetical protein
MTPLSLAELMAGYSTPPVPQSDLGRAFEGVRSGQRLLAAVDAALFRTRFLTTVPGACSPDMAAVMLRLEQAAKDAAEILGEPEPLPLPLAGVDGFIQRGAP